MQYADYAATRTNAAAERDRLMEMGFLSELEGTAVDLTKINAFFQSGLAQRIFSAEKLMREQKFAIRIPARELYPELPENAEDEAIVVQGIADCAFVENGELVILDYKTDRGVTLEMLAVRYKGQLAIYKRALEECLEIKVKETLLYSFELGASVAV
jgi:ATP-dependent helicase/nuclease subunit A